MFLYTTIEAIAGIVALIVLAVCTKKREDVVYGKLDKAGRITNIILIPVYMCMLPLCIFLGMISSPAHDGFLGILGWIISIINASTTLFCGVGIGLSVFLRKMGKSRLSFAVQFAGFVGGVITVAFYMIFAGNLLKYLN